MTDNPSTWGNYVTADTLTCEVRGGFKSPLGHIPATRLKSAVAFALPQIRIVIQTHVVGHSDGERGLQRLHLQVG